VSAPLLNAASLQALLRDPLTEVHVKADPDDPESEFDVLVVHPDRDCVSALTVSRGTTKPRVAAWGHAVLVRTVKRRAAARKAAL
jgi:hypothetical protein